MTGVLPMERLSPEIRFVLISFEQLKRVHRPRLGMISRGNEDGGGVDSLLFLELRSQIWSGVPLLHSLNIENAMFNPGSYRDQFSIGL
jgi:hypothetical protein